MSTNKISFALCVVCLMLLVGAAESRSTQAATMASLLEPDACGACAPAPACPAPCPPKITYRQHGCRKVCCGCEAPVQTALEVKDPCSCSCGTVIIPICLPACITTPPCVTSHCGLLGRGVVNYEYSNGFRIKIVFQHSGDIVVHTYGS